MYGSMGWHENKLSSIIKCDYILQLNENELLITIHPAMWSQSDWKFSILTVDQAWVWCGYVFGFRYLRRGPSRDAGRCKQTTGYSFPPSLSTIWPLFHTLHCLLLLAAAEVWMLNVAKLRGRLHLSMSATPLPWWVQVCTTNRAYR